MLHVAILIVLVREQALIRLDNVANVGYKMEADKCAERDHDEAEEDDLILVDQNENGQPRPQKLSKVQSCLTSFFKKSQNVNESKSDAESETVSDSITDTVNDTVSVSVADVNNSMTAPTVTGRNLMETIT